MNTDELKKELDRFNREQENIFNLHREIERLRAENAGLLRENMDLRARLYDQGQHPGFPQPPAGSDPDEPVAGTASGPGQEQLTRYIGHWILPVDDEPVAGTA